MPWRQACTATATVGEAHIGDKCVATATATAGEAPRWRQMCTATTTETAMFGETSLHIWGRRRCMGWIQQREGRQTTWNNVTNERRRHTGGSGVTRGNTTTICMIGQGAGQCYKLTRHRGCNQRWHRADLQ